MQCIKVWLFHADMLYMGIGNILITNDAIAMMASTSRLLRATSRSEMWYMMQCCGGAMLLQ
jgi:hypothetical protein